MGGTSSRGDAGRLQVANTAPSAVVGPIVTVLVKPHLIFFLVRGP